MLIFSDQITFFIFGSEFTQISEYLLIYCFAYSSLATINVFISYFLGKNRRKIVILMPIIILVELLGFLSWHESLLLIQAVFAGTAIICVIILVIYLIIDCRTTKTIALMED